MIFGVDLGVRTVHVVGLPAELGQEILMVKLDTPKATRYAEVRALVMGMSELSLEGDTVFIEEPPLAGRMNIRTFGQLSITAGAILSATSAQGYLVPVSTWKKATIGNGSADKATVSTWLAGHHEQLHALCHGDQNFVDASCLALYGVRTLATAGGITAASARHMDPTL